MHSELSFGTQESLIFPTCNMEINDGDINDSSLPCVLQIPHPILFLQEAYEVGSIVIPALQMRKQNRFRKKMPNS